MPAGKAVNKSQPEYVEYFTHMTPSYFEVGKVGKGSLMIIRLENITLTNCDH